MSDYYEAALRWPHPGASDVIVTGSFDSWSCSHHLTRTPSGHFEGTIKVPWGETVQYKYIVDGRWTTTDDQPTELDPIGNLNNVLRAPARPPTPPPTPKLSPAKAEPDTVVAKVSGYVETARQAVVGMVEAMAPGTTETPAETPVAETSEPDPTPAPAPAPAQEPTPVPEEKPTAPPKSEPEPASVPAPSPSEPELTTTDLTASAVLPASSDAPLASDVPVVVLPLSTEPPLTEVPAALPSTDVSESKELETTVVEGSATAENAVKPDVPAAGATAGAPSVGAAGEVVPLTADATATATKQEVQEETEVAASKALETTVVQGSATAETAETAAAAPEETVTEAPAADAEAKPSTHTPAGPNGTADDKLATKDAEPAPSASPAHEKTQAPVNGTNGTTKTAPTPPPPPAAASPAFPATPPRSNGTSPSSTPAKEKRMRFPSLSSRSLHARSRSSVESSEFGEAGAGANGSGSRSVSGSPGKSGEKERVKGGTERARRRTGVFGKLKGVFGNQHKHESSA